MRNKLLFAAGVGLGYVFGTKAGRERYDQIRRSAQKVKENPTVQEAAGVLQAQAGTLASTARTTVNDKFGHTAVGQKVSGLLGQAETKATPDDVHVRPAGSNGVANLN